MKTKKSKAKMAGTRGEIGSGSVYEQLGYKNYKEMETKATLVMEIHAAIKNKKMTQTKAAKILGLKQPKLSALLNGHFRGYSVERLIHFLTELGKDIDIVVKTKPRHRNARIQVYHSNHGDRPNTHIAAKGKY